MATTSINHNFSLHNKRDVDLFIDAIEKAEEIDSFPQKLPGRHLTDADEIKNFITMRKKKNAR